MGTSSALLPSDIILYSFESEFLESMIRSGHSRLARSFGLRYQLWMICLFSTIKSLSAGMGAGVHIPYMNIIT